MFRLFLFLSAALLATASCIGQTDIYRPYRFVDKWEADTLYIGASFRYNGNGPMKITLEWSETSVDGKLYVISPIDGNPVFVMTNRQAVGTTIDLTSLLPFRAGNEIVFMYDPAYGTAVNRYTGPNRRGDRYFTPISSDLNPNPRLRFGHRYAVAGKIGPNLIEFGIEDTNGTLGDMDFNDIHFTLTNADLLLYMNGAKKRAYVW